MKKTNEMVKVTKSWKYENTVFITDTQGKDHKRGYYERKNSKGSGNHFYFYFEGQAFSFRFGTDGKEVENIVNEGAYKDFIKTLDKAPAAKTEEKKVEFVEVEDNGEVKHEKYNHIKACIEKNIPVYLVGPAGSGKNHVLEQIAWDLGLDFYFTNSIQQEYKLTGFISPKLNGEDVFVETEFYRAFTKGGLFFLDEMDASIPEVLVLLNAAIANGYFEFPGMGKITAHEKFRVVAAGNTVGNGADEQYIGRLVLDQATLDRFATIEFGYSLKIEMHIAKNNTELVDFIRGLRKQAEEKGIRATFSYRCISMVTKLEGVLELSDVLVMAIFKGMDKDTVNTFKTEGYNKYQMALKKVQA